MENLAIFKSMISILIMLCLSPLLLAQQQINSPTFISKGVYHGLSECVSEMPVVSEKEFQVMALEAAGKILNPKIRKRSFPYADDALPKGPDPVWQHDQGTTADLGDASLIFDGLTSPYWPTDANGSAGHNYYMQAINKVFAIYDKASGSMVAGPTFFHHLFSGVMGSECNSGDPVVIYDEKANRWVATEMSLCGENDYILVAVSASSNPKGSWHKYSFDVDDVPDYEKIAVWKNAYCMSTNNGYGEDIFALQRDVMLAGGSEPLIVGWDNAYRPFPPDEFHYVPPVDNDGEFAPDLPSGGPAPALFITINDDAVNGGTDELWIFELNVDWSDPDRAEFNRVQQIAVPFFDSNFGSTSNAIPQPDQGGYLDALPNFIMHRAQYRNFTSQGGSEVIVCCHTVDVNGDNYSGIRWYELRKEDGLWDVYQSGTYAPLDGLYRWMGSIAMNGSGEIALGYSVSSTQEYPGIRYVGQSPNMSGSGEMNYIEQNVHTGYATFGLNRWGDYWNMAVDPSDDQTFWFTAQYCDEYLQTKIAAFDFSPPVLMANFSAEPKHVWKGNYTKFTDRSTGPPTSWMWTFEGGDPSTFSGQFPPVVQYNYSGNYDVTLEVSDEIDTRTITRTAFIEVEDSPYCISRGDAANHWIKSIGVGGHGTYVSGSSGYLGYQDLSDLHYDFEVDVPYDLQVTPGYIGRSSAYYYRFWIDLNHDNIFSDPEELVIAANKKRNRFSTTLTVPSDALPGLTKMRVSMQQGSAPLSCDIFTNGEVEDHSVFITAPAPPPPQLPIADFIADRRAVLVGESVKFTDQSNNQPHTWFWEFEGGNPPTSTVQNPMVEYNTLGDFSVQLTATNDAGSDIDFKSEYISVVEDLPLTYCEPQSINNSRYYIDAVQIGTQTSSSGQGPSGYHYFTDPVFMLMPDIYPISLTPNILNRKFSWKIWIDANKDGYFNETTETLLAENNVKGIINSNIEITPFTDPTRMRISMKLADTGPLPCDDNFTGEVEDYNVTDNGADLLLQAEHSGEMTIQIYPNPLTTDELHVTVLQAKWPYTIHLYDGRGMLLDNFQSAKSNIVLNTSSYPRGIIFIKISNDETQIVRKFIKMK